jgi:hypothetical protein
MVAGEILYRLCSTLHHLLWQLVLVSGNADKLTTRHQFRIFITQGSFLTDAPKMTDGVSGDIARIIERQQPFARLPNHPADDMLWLLHQLNITDKHRLVPLSVVGIDVISANSNNLPAFTVQSPDIRLEHEKVLFSLNWMRLRGVRSAVGS